METKLFALIGCSKKKRTTKDPFKDMIPARDLYTSDLFQKRVAHVESRGLPWMILSAKSGCVTPRTPLRVYDHTIRDKEQIDLAAWATGCATMFIDHLYYDHGARDLRTVAVEIHAGKAYLNPLADILKTLGVTVYVPVYGMGIGQQLAYYSEKAKA